MSPMTTATGTRPQGNSAQCPWTPECAECKIRFTSLQEGQEGVWTCSVNKEGLVHNETVLVAEALRANLQWSEDLLGTLYLTQGEEEMVTCSATHSRPLGKFSYQLFKEEDISYLVSSQEEIVSSDAAEISNASLS